MKFDNCGGRGRTNLKQSKSNEGPNSVPYKSTIAALRIALKRLEDPCMNFGNKRKKKQ